MFNIITPNRIQERPRVTMAQAAEHLNVTRQYIYKLISMGKLIPHMYLGRKCLYLDQCVLPKKKHTEPGEQGGFRKRRTKAEIKLAKQRILQKRYRRMKRKRMLELLSPEEKLKLERRYRNTKMKKYRRLRRIQEKKRMAVQNET